MSSAHEIMNNTFPESRKMSKFPQKWKLLSEMEERNEILSKSPSSGHPVGNSPHWFLTLRRTDVYLHKLNNYETIRAIHNAQVLYASFMFKYSQMSS